MLRDGSCTVAAFHPELTVDNRLHEMFLESITAAS
jgi:glutamine amidotransferase PdxT